MGRNQESARQGKAFSGLPSGKCPNTKRPDLTIQPKYLFDDSASSQFTDVLGQLGLQVCCFVSVDKMAHCQLVQYFLYARIHCYSFCLVCSCTKFSYSITHGLGIISVVQSSLFSLSDSFDR